MNDNLKPGICSFCSQTMSKRKMMNHIISCKEKLTYDSSSVEQNFITYFTILIEGKYNPSYWIIAEVSSVMTLKVIDQFLRDIWLECCEHLSEFSKNRNKISMKRKLYDVFNEFIDFEYEYDFGSTTELKLKVISKVELNKKFDIRILAMNLRPEIKCSVCQEKPAIGQCDICFEEILCEECIKSHPCFEDEQEQLISDIVNSPRSNVCGYTGPNTNLIKKFFPKVLPNIF
jgi:hypothetical protein